MKKIFILTMPSPNPCPLASVGGSILISTFLWADTLNFSKEFSRFLLVQSTDSKPLPLTAF
jgi:hypothetical protein